MRASPVICERELLLRLGPPPLARRGLGPIALASRLCERSNRTRSRCSPRYRFIFLTIRIDSPERERFLQSFPGYNGEQSQDKSKSDPRHRDIITGYEELRDLPPLIPRYEKLNLPHDWYMPGKSAVASRFPRLFRLSDVKFKCERLKSNRKLNTRSPHVPDSIDAGKRKIGKRDHRKSHGVATFQEIAKFVADGWKSIDDETLAYCTEVARILKQRHRQLKKMGGLKAFAESRLAGRPKAVTSSAPVLPRVKSHADLAAAAPLPKIKDFVCSVPFVALSTDCSPVRESSSVAKDCFANGTVQKDLMMPKMEDFIWSAPPFEVSPDCSRGASGGASVSSVASDLFGSGDVQEDCFSGVAWAEGVPAPQRRFSSASLPGSHTRAEGVPALQRRFSTSCASLSSMDASMHSQVDISDLDIMGMWFKAR